MSMNLSGACATVSESGQITSNGNFSCQMDGGGTQYVIDYNNSVVNPVPVVSLTSPDPTLTYVLNTYVSGCRIYIYQLTSNGPVPASSSFDLIVGSMS
ncbi:MAG: hypothetical protein AB8B56_08985 [Crocinitomicaceae bacterium]